MVIEGSIYIQSSIVEMQLKHQKVTLEQLFALFLHSRQYHNSDNNNYFYFMNMQK